MNHCSLAKPDFNLLQSPRRASDRSALHLASVLGKHALAQFTAARASVPAALSIVRLHLNSRCHRYS